jgi:DNA polymerase elongation subunit (family B)
MNIEKYPEIIKEIINESLVLDIECWSDYDISKDFDNYVANAKIKWIGFYSYKTKKNYELPVAGNESLIKEFIEKHKYIVTFNGLEFDVPILKNNNLWPDNYFIEIDLKKILGSKIEKGEKNRGALMGFSFKKESLKEMAITMKLETLKDDINHDIWKKDFWSKEEIIQIKKYSRADVEVTRLMYEKVIDFWYIFAVFLSEKDINKCVWIKSSVASLVYAAACKKLGEDPTYGRKGKETDGGGRVIEPRVEEAWNVWYVDVASLYPHIYAMFNLMMEVSREFPDAWHGNEVFKVNGYYDISKNHILCLDLMEKIKNRLELKAKDPKNPLVYAYKIYCNTFYGINRSEVFEKVHTENSGEDCCYIGRQINEIIEVKGKELGYITLAGDTDSCFWQCENGEKTHEDVTRDLKTIVEYINSFAPFNFDTFKIDIEDYCHYIMWVNDEEKGKTLKKNYCYIRENFKKKCKEVVIKGLPIKKINSTQLGPLIFEKYIKPRMLEEIKGKFEKEWFLKLIDEELEKNIELMAQEYTAKDYSSYSFAGKKSLPGQISKSYLNEKNGSIYLIKNTRVGRVGGKFKYCTIEEAKQFKLQKHELELEKVYNELSPFVKGGLDYDNSSKKKPVDGFFNNKNNIVSSDFSIKENPFDNIKKDTLEIKKGGFFK